MAHPVITIHMKNKKQITMELYPDKAPNGVNSILELAQMNAYDNLSIQRIAPGFVLQPWYDEKRMGPEFQYIMKGEFSAAGHDNDLAFEKYTVGLGGDGSSISACGCIFIVIGDGYEQRLGGKFTAVGKVVDGFGEVQRITQVETRDIESGMEGVVVKEPLHPEIIETITVTYNGYTPSPVDKFLPE